MSMKSPGQRVRHEAENLMGQFWAGSLFKTLALSFRDLVVVVGAVAALGAVGYYGFGQPDCLHGCGSTSSFCWSLACVGLIALFSLGVFLGSYFSSRLVQEGRFQRSAIASALLVLAVIICGIVFKFSLLAAISLALVSFFAMFFGYRAACRSISRAQNNN